MKYTPTPVQVRPTSFAALLPRSVLALISALALGLLLTGCGPATATPTPAPTATNIPVYVYVPPTIPPAFASAVSASAEGTSAATSTPDAGRIALGKSRYEALQCGNCHGDAGQGTDKGKALAGTKLSQDDFINFLRTGGTVGSSHLFSTNRLSETGGENLYLYVLSLTQASSTQQASTQAGTQQP